jgi:CDP-glycerol glycerophosphotransferase (TagB/SpsB family)
LKNFAGIKFNGQIDLAKRMESEYDHVRFLGPEVYNIVPFYSAADVLITEASSTIYEMMAIDTSAAE